MPVFEGLAEVVVAEAWISAGVLEPHLSWISVLHFA
jgi:hypothetical protein